jgi:hypothetical protein
MGGGEGEQVEDGDPEGHDRRRSVLASAEDDVEDPPVRAVQPVEVVEQRIQELVQPGERQLRLGFDARRPDHPVLFGRREFDDVVQQSALAHPCVTAQDESPPLGRRHERRQHLLLALAADHGPDDRLHAPTPFTAEPARPGRSRVRAYGSRQAQGRGYVVGPDSHMPGGWAHECGPAAARSRTPPAED